MSPITQSDADALKREASRRDANDEFRPSREEKLKDDGTSYATPQWVIKFPEIPESQDLILRWLTGVLMLDHNYPIYKVVRSGEYGPDGVVTLHRKGAREVRFLPCTRLSSSLGVTAALNAYMIPTDLKPFPYTDQNCSDIWYAVRQIAVEEGAESLADQGRVILNMFLQDASPISDHTAAGTAAECYEAIQALRSISPSRNGGLGLPSYLIDASTGMFVIRASDLQPYARLALGVVSRGDLDRMLIAADWTKHKVQGWQKPGRRDRGDHNRAVVWTGTI
jgi:hypothetical protein